MQETFKIKENGFEEIKKSILIKTIPIIAIAAITGIAIGYFNSKNSASTLNILPYLIPILVLFITLVLFRSIKRLKTVFESFTLTIEEDQLIREQINMPVLIIPFHEIKSIQRGETGIITISGVSKLSPILIPKQMEDLDRIATLLETIHPIDELPPKLLISRLKWPLLLLIISLMTCVGLSENKVVLGISGLIICCILLWSLFILQRSKNVDRRTKRRSWFILVVLVSILINVYLKLKT